jgi:hypothetical protein
VIGRMFVFALTVLGIVIAIGMPAGCVGYVLVSRWEHSPGLLWGLLAGFLVYVAAAAVAVTLFLLESGLAGWVEQ